MTAISWDPDGQAGAWIAGRLGEFGTVGGNVPLGYECYVSIPNSADPDNASDGTIDLADDGARLQQLLDVLLPAGAEQSIHCALWNGYGFLYDHGTDPALSGSVGVLVAVGDDALPLRYDSPGSSASPADVGPEAVPGIAPAGLEEAAEAALHDQGTDRWTELQRRAHEELWASLVERPARLHLQLPHRDYYLWSGGREVASAVAHQDQSPTLFFAADRSWFVNSDLDSARTEIGGTAALLAPLLGPRWGGLLVRTDSPITAVWDTHPQANS